ncbi:hypothetical protein NYE39_01850 [Janibacter sp. FSL W8-0316]|uniref:Uncharacterized protein n=1 Tax=Tessaracoccus flavescens TaxID=399497 RepID=A0A1Q2CU31_9ACTN|nr:hypothetical protein [Tessaracoccus flavescens]AQP49607.1 hypothetical protein BW733_00915 [Tessaracoccus flavescens]
MTGQHDRQDWCGEFTAEELSAIRRQVPHAIQRSQERSARAHTEYDDPDGDQDVYGAGMSRGVQKELRPLLANLSSYSEMQVPRSRRTLTFLGDALIFPLRVGKQMPRNHRRIRLNYLPESRRELLEQTSNTKYVDAGLFELDETPGTEQPARLDDALTLLSEGDTRATLFVPYYSSSPQGVGTIYFAPARLNGRYLEFTDPERLTYQVPVAGEEPAAVLAPVGGFADGDRPRTTVKLRPRPTEKEDS